MLSPVPLAILLNPANFSGVQSVVTSEQNVLFIFPGQGSQYKGMGGDLFKEHEVARKIYTKASEVLGYDVAELSFEDPKEQLNLTRFTQPALLTHSIACLEVFRELTEDRLQPSMVAGHSLGEYSALVAAKALSFESALGLVLQTPNQLPDTPGAKSIIENTQVLYVLNNEKGYKPIIDRFNLTEHDNNQLMSIRNKFNGEVQYSEFMLKRGCHSHIYRLELPREVYCAYQTDGEEYEKIMALYKSTGDMETAINQHIKQQN